MKYTMILPIISIVLLNASLIANAQELSILHSFTGGSDGFQPQGALTLSDSFLYGTTSSGGSTGVGTIFKIGANGNDYSVIHTFTDFSDGGTPFDSLTPSGSTLYGTTSGFNPADSSGTIFKIQTDGSGYSVLHSFGNVGDGWAPWGNLTINGSIMYGTTYQGGDSNAGVIFQIGTNGAGYKILHSFSNTDGWGPGHGNLILIGSKLYGMTQEGGSADRGVIYSFDTDGNDFRILHSFTGGSDGSIPWGGLTLSGSTLYGMTNIDGNYDNGTIFKINADGSGYNVLYSFTGGNDGASPFSSLIVNGSTLYGTAAYGGNGGTVFQINTDGSGFDVLHSFTYGIGDGVSPFGALMLDGATLYGTTSLGGSNDIGTVFSLTVPEPCTIVLFGMCALSLLAYAWRRRK